MSTRSGNSKRSPSSDASSPPGKRLAFEPSEVSNYESKHKYFYFKLDNGKHEWCASKKEADDFLEDFSTIVVDKQSFSLKKDFTKHKAATIKADKERRFNFAQGVHRSSPERSQAFSSGVFGC